MMDTTPLNSTFRELPLEPGGTVDIVLTNGSVRVTGTGRDVVTVRSRGGEDIDDEVEIHADPDRISIRSRVIGFSLGSLRIGYPGPSDLEVEVPRDAAVSLRTLSGDVVASGVRGTTRWATASGELRLDVDGGTVAIESMSGDVALHAGAPIDLQARSVSGTLDLGAPRLERLAASTTSGDIRVQADLSARGEHTLSSVSGDVELATASPIRATTQSITGDLRVAGEHRVEGGRGGRTVVVGDGSVAVSVRTTSGDMRIRAGVPAAAASSAPATHAAPAATPDAEPTAAPGSPAARTPAAPVILVAEAEAAPNLVRRAPAEPPADPASGAESPTDRREAARLEILRALERGELDVEAASHRLEILEDAGPRAFRGWC